MELARHIARTESTKNIPHANFPLESLNGNY